MRKFLFVLLTAISLLISWINFKLHPANPTVSTSKTDIKKQLAYLKIEIRNKQAAERMQAVFPEGFVFLHALYGLSWCELSAAFPGDSLLRKEAVSEALYAYRQIDSEKGKSTFDAGLTPDHGIFYTGWKNYLLSHILLTDSGFTNAAAYKNRLIRETTDIILALEAADSPYLQSYRGMSWPADMCVAMAAVSNCNKLYKLNETAVHNWITEVESTVDSYTGMLPHSAGHLTGRPEEGSRGSSSSLIIRMLTETDSAFAAKQSKLYTTYFVDHTFGLPAVREYPRGKSGYGDIDSGPVIAGTGFTATIVAIGTLARTGLPELAMQQYATINAFGFESTTDSTKKYIFGQLPVADAFICWGRASALKTLKSDFTLNPGWQTGFHFRSAGALLVFWLLFYYKTTRNYFTRKFKNNPKPSS